MSQEIGAVESASDFLKRKAGDSRPEDMLPILENAGREPPMPGDELPPGWQRPARKAG